MQAHAKKKQKGHSRNTKIKDQESEIIDFLNSQTVGILSTIEPHTHPHPTVVNISVNNTFCLKFNTKRGSRKHKNICNDDRASILVFDEKTKTTALVSGIVREISEGQNTCSTIAVTTDLEDTPPHSNVSLELQPNRIEYSRYLPVNDQAHHTLTF